MLLASAQLVAMVTGLLLASAAEAV